MITEEQLKIKIQEKRNKISEEERKERLINEAINNLVCPTCGEDLTRVNSFIFGLKAICKSCGFEHTFETYI